MALDLESFPMRLFRKSYDLGWDPRQIDFSRERDDWASLTADEQTMMLRHVAGFYLGERSVTHDLAPLQQCLRREGGRMDEEMYLTAQLYEESRHVEFFQLWMNEALPGELGVEIPYPELMPPGVELEDLLTVKIFHTFQSLAADPSPENQVRAVVVYHMIIEGVSAEAGYHLFFDMLAAKKVMPGLRQGITLIQRDESRHVAFGIYLLQRLISEHPELTELFEREMHLLSERAIQGTQQSFAWFDEPYPFGLHPDRYQKLANQYFQTRLEAVKRGTLVEV